MAERISKFKQALKMKQAKKGESTNEGFFDKEMRKFQDKGDKENEENKGTRNMPKKVNAMEPSGNHPVSKHHNTDTKLQRRRGNEKGNILEEILQTSQRLNATNSHSAIKTAKKEPMMTRTEVKATTTTLEKRSDSRDSKTKKDISISDEDIVSTLGIFNMGRGSKLIQRTGNKRARDAKGEEYETKKSAPKGDNPQESKQEKPPGINKHADRDEGDLNVFSSLRQEIQKYACSKDVPQTQITKNIREIERLHTAPDFEDVSEKCLGQAEANSNLLCKVNELSESIRELGESIQFPVAKRKINLGHFDGPKSPAKTHGTTSSKRHKTDEPVINLESPQHLTPPRSILSPVYFTPTPARSRTTTAIYLTPPTMPHTSTMDTPDPLFVDENSGGSFKYDPESPFIQPIEDRPITITPKNRHTRQHFLEDMFY